jgi:hypothetical protein
MKPLPGEPEGYRELCAQLQREKNPSRFSALLHEIDVLLAEHARRTAAEQCSADRPPAATAGGGSTPHITLTQKKS